METVLVTGASSGIGQHLAQKFAAEGCRMVLTARRTDRLQQLAEQLSQQFGVDCEVIACDLADPLGVDHLVEQLNQHGIEIDVLVNNAGFGESGKFHMQPAQRVQDLVQVNVLSAARLFRLLLPGMLERDRGGVLNVASTASFQPGPNMATYYASKGFLRYLSEAVAYELQRTNVTVSCLCPGPTRTDFFEEADLEHSNLFRMAMPVERVAAAGHRGYRRGKRVVIPGLLNRVIVFHSWLYPAWIVRPITSWLHRGG